MIARSEVGLLVAGMGFAMGVIPQNIYVILVITCLATTIVSRFLMKVGRKHIGKQQEQGVLTDSRKMKKC